ncbi:MAG: ABC transporter substrate-binding protein [Clostridiales bacterium]|nr:ABC transporter substrate-binding protein [Clostridiales bacterium]
MKKLKKLISITACAAIAALTACAPKPAAPSADAKAPGSPGAPLASESGGITIGVVQYVQHEALDKCYAGFLDALSDNGYKTDGSAEGFKSVTIDYQNALGDSSNLSAIGDRFVSEGAGLIFAITTPAAEAMAGKTTEIPIVASAVTSYTEANLVDSDEAPGGNVTGTSDMNPVAAQIDFARELVPNLKTVGLLYNAGEANSVLQINIAKKAIEDSGLAWTEATVANTNDVLQATQALADKCEAIYIPTDNIVASSMSTVYSVTEGAKLPTICGEAGMVLSGGLATLGIDYEKLGYQSGLMAIDVLNGKKPAEMPIQTQTNYQVTINGQAADEMGFAVPDKYKDSVIYPEKGAEQ